MRGRSISLSPIRRAVTKLMRLSAGVPLSAVERRLDVENVVAAKRAAGQPIPWTAIFMKAYALVANEVPELRRVYLRYPYGHLYEYPTSIGSLTIEREADGEMCVFVLLVKDPAALPLADIGRQVSNAQNAPIEDIKAFQRALRIIHYPRIVQFPIWWVGYNVGRVRANHFGTFGVTTFSGLGAESHYFQTPLTTTLNYGIIRDGKDLDSRIMIDHRVIDGSTSARVLLRLQQILDGPIVDELRNLANP